MEIVFTSMYDSVRLYRLYVPLINRNKVNIELPLKLTYFLTFSSAEVVIENSYYFLGIAMSFILETLVQEYCSINFHFSKTSIKL